MKNDLDREIRARIDGFLHELSLLVKRSALESVHAALSGGTAAPARRGRRGAPRRAAAGKRRGRTPAPEIAAIGEKLLAHLRANPGQRLEEIGRSLKSATKILKRPIAKLVADKKLRTEGQRRGMRYFVGGGGRGARGTRRRGKGRRRAA